MIYKINILHHSVLRARNVCGLCMKAFCDAEHVFPCTLPYFLEIALLQQLKKKQPNIEVLSH